MGTRSPDGPKQATSRPKKQAPREAGCRASLGGAPPVTGTATLARDELRFHTGRTGRRGKDFFVHVRFDDIRALEVDAREGALHITPADGEEVVLFFSQQSWAAEWKRMIEQRPRLLDGLDVPPRGRVAVVGVDDEALVAELVARCGGLAEGDGLDALFFGVAHRADLRALPQHSARLREGGVLWAVKPESAPIHTHDIEAAAAACGLVAGAELAMTRDLAVIRLSKRP
jgi:hypothetical protein